MIDTKNKSSIYVDIQSLLDLRQAFLSKLMDLETLTTFINSDEYNFRELDVFPVDMKEYESIQNKNDISVLARSTITYILNALQSKVAGLEKRNNFYGETKTPEVILNIYPYNLPSDHIEALQNMLFVKLGSKCLVTVINKHIDDITPHFIKSSNIVTLFIYDFSKWLNKHTDSVRVLKLPDVLFYFPSLYKVKDTNNEIEKITKTGFKDLFAYLEFMYSSVMNINFLPVLFYSNIVTSSIILEKYSSQIKNFNVLEEKDKDANSSRKI